MCDIEAGFEGIETEELAKLRADNEKYRDALKRIAGRSMSMFISSDDMALSCKQIAIHALEK